MKNIQSNIQVWQYMLKNDYEIVHLRTGEFKEEELHCHDFYEVNFCLTGKVTYIVEGRSYVLRTDDVILVSPGELYQILVEDACECMILRISPQLLKSLGSEQTNLATCFERTQQTQCNLVRLLAGARRFKFDMHRLLSESGRSIFGNDILYKVCIQQIFIELNRFMQSPSYRMGSENIAIDKLVHGVLNYINNNLLSELDLDKIARMFYVSKSHMARRFKKFYGTTIYQYILKKRLMLAKQLIMKGLPIEDVYSQSGFGDYSNFFRAFKMEYGITPKEYYKLVAGPSKLI